MYLCMSSAVMRVQCIGLCFFVSSACFMCLFSMCCRNISAMVPDIEM
jgi:hypothetical protein